MSHFQKAHPIFSANGCHGKQRFNTLNNYFPLLNHAEIESRFSPAAITTTIGNTQNLGTLLQTVMSSIVQLHHEPNETFIIDVDKDTTPSLAVTSVPKAKIQEQWANWHKINNEEQKRINALEKDLVQLFKQQLNNNGNHNNSNMDYQLVNAINTKSHKYTKAITTASKKWANNYQSKYVKKLQNIFDNLNQNTQLLNDVVMGDVLVSDLVKNDILNKDETIKEKTFDRVLTDNSEKLNRDSYHIKNSLILNSEDRKNKKSMDVDSDITTNATLKPGKGGKKTKKKGGKDKKINKKRSDKEDDVNDRESVYRELDDDVAIGAKMKVKEIEAKQEQLKREGIQAKKKDNGDILAMASKSNSGANDQNINNEEAKKKKNGDTMMVAQDDDDSDSDGNNEDDDLPQIQEIGHQDEEDELEVIISDHEKPIEDHNEDHIMEDELRPKNGDKKRDNFNLRKSEVNIQSDHGRTDENEPMEDEDDDLIKAIEVTNNDDNVAINDNILLIDDISPKDNDEAANEFLCSQCGIEYGSSLIGCDHKLCLTCCQKWILDGINTNKWLSQLVCCPKCDNDSSEIPLFLRTECKFTEEEKKKLQSQESIYMTTLSQLCITDGCNEIGEEIGSCNHNLCKECCKKYLLQGIVSNKWAKESLSCPIKECDIILSNRIISQCGISMNMKNKIELMKNEYTKCPQCCDSECKGLKDEETDSYQGDEYTHSQNQNQNQLSVLHKKHRGKYRFGCNKTECGAIFCSGCKVTPYHTGYTCDQYKEYLNSKKCRFCSVSLNDMNTSKNDNNYNDGLIDNVCNSEECLKKKMISCDLKHNDCGHNCIGLRGYECIKCLNSECLPKNADITDDDYCNICWLDPLSAAPCINLECGHCFHFECLKNKILKTWTSPRIAFGFLNCPLCSKEIHHPALNDITKDSYALKLKLEKQSVEYIRLSGLENDERLTKPSSPYFNDIKKYSMDRLSFYLCNKCNVPYFGGMKECEEVGRDQQGDGQGFDNKHLICGSCASGDKKEKCAKHGSNYISWKCTYCCHVAVWYWNDGHFCSECYLKKDTLIQEEVKPLQNCDGKGKCALGKEHPLNGSNFYAGCIACDVEGYNNLPPASFMNPIFAANTTIESDGGSDFGDIKMALSQRAEVHGIPPQNRAYFPINPRVPISMNITGDNYDDSDDNDHDVKPPPLKKQKQN